MNSVHCISVDVHLCYQQYTLYTYLSRVVSINEYCMWYHFDGDFCCNSIHCVNVDGHLCFESLHSRHVIYVAIVSILSMSLAHKCTELWEASWIDNVGPLFTLSNASFQHFTHHSWMHLLMSVYDIHPLQNPQVCSLTVTWGSTCPWIEVRPLLPPTSSAWKECFFYPVNVNVIFQHKCNSCLHYLHLWWKLPI